MRKEATLNQWRVLYETATRIKEKKPWETFMDMDLLGFRYGAKEDTIYFSILGHHGDCYGIAVYEGYSGLNDFLMLVMQEDLNIPWDFAMANQRNLTCYWGDRQELNKKQWQIVKNLGYKYRGKNQWLYFMSFEPGYAPFNLDQDEVLRMTEYLQGLEKILEYYEENDVNIDFKNGNILCMIKDQKNNTVRFEEEPLPFFEYCPGILMPEDESFIEELKRMPVCRARLEADIFPMRTSIADSKYDRPADPFICLIMDAASGMVINFEMTEPGESAELYLAEMIAGFILQYGKPKEIRISNRIVEAAIKNLCDAAGIKLRFRKTLRGVEDFKWGMHERM